MALRDNDGYTPLHLAAREGHVDAFREMLRKGTALCIAAFAVLLFLFYEITLCKRRSISSSFFLFFRLKNCSNKSVSC